MCHLIFDTLYAFINYYIFSIMQSINIVEKPLNIKIDIGPISLYSDFNM